MALLFSVLIANHNRAKYIKECVSSILQQSYNNWEVIFVDDNSNDNSIQIIKEIIKDDKRFKIFKNDCNKGCGYTKKKCIDLANGEICGFLDSDDILTKDSIKLMVLAHQDHPEVSIIGSRRAICNDKMKIIDVSPSLINVSNYFKSQLDNPFTISHFVTFKKKFYNKTNGIDSSLMKAVDQDLYYKLEEQGKVGFINKVLYYYRLNDLSISLFNNQYKADAWHLYVIYNTCLRRHLKFDDYCYLMKKTKSKKEKIINYIFLPYQIIKEKIKKIHNILIYNKHKDKEQLIII